MELKFSKAKTVVAAIGELCSLVVLLLADNVLTLPEAAELTAFIVTQVGTVVAVFWKRNQVVSGAPDATVETG